MTEEIKKEEEISDEEFDRKLTMRGGFRDRLEDIEKSKEKSTIGIAKDKIVEKLSFKDKMRMIDEEAFEELDDDVSEEDISVETASVERLKEREERIKKTEDVVEDLVKEKVEGFRDIVKAEKKTEKGIEEENVDSRALLAVLQSEIPQQVRNDKLGEVEPVRPREKSQYKSDNSLLSIPTVVTGDFEFPDGFLWGSSTSAYQVEGGIENDWSEWERSEKRIAYLKKQGKNIDDFICEKACDSWNRYKEDFDLAVEMNMNTIRFGVEWARIETGNNVWDVEAVKHYREMLKYAKSKGLKVVLTIWHWTNPIWFTEMGGWANKESVEYFDRFSHFVVKEFGGYVDYWVTLNEPMVHVGNGYITGRFPPGKRNIFKARKVFKNLIKGHKIAYNNIHKVFPEAKVSITGLLNYFEPARKWNPIEIVFAKIGHYFVNHRFLTKIKRHIDYIGFDYYFHVRIVCYPPFKKNKNERVTRMNWEIYPEGIYHVLKYLKKFKKPVIIMENGLADDHDKYRDSFIKEHLYWVHKAIQEGVDVRGYCHWSLLDNFEWADGLDPKFGLCSVDRETFERKPKSSAKVYGEICKRNKLSL